MPWVITISICILVCIVPVLLCWLSSPDTLSHYLALGFRFFISSVTQHCIRSPLKKVKGTDLNLWPWKSERYDVRHKLKFVTLNEWNTDLDVWPWRSEKHWPLSVTLKKKLSDVEFSLAFRTYWICSLSISPEI